MSSGCDPVSVEYGSPATVRAGEPKEGGSSDRDLPRPLPEGRLLAADDPSLGPGKQGRQPAGHVTVLRGRGHRQHRASSRRRRLGGAHCHFRRRSLGRRRRGSCCRSGRRRRGGHRHQGRLLRRPRLCRRVQVGRRYVVG